MANDYSNRPISFAENGPFSIREEIQADIVQGHLTVGYSDGAGVERGLYEIQFDVAEYYRTNGVNVPDPSFLEVAVKGHFVPHSGH